jgi:hypothetical protein
MIYKVHLVLTFLIGEDKMRRFLVPRSSSEFLWFRRPTSTYVFSIFNIKNYTGISEIRRLILT